MLRDILPRMGEDSALSGLLDKLRTAQQTYISQTNDYGPSSQEVIRAKSMIVELNNEIDASVNGVMAGMESKTRAVKAALDELTTTVDNSITSDLKEAEHG